MKLGGSGQHHDALARGAFETVGGFAAPITGFTAPPGGMRKTNEATSRCEVHALRVAMNAVGDFSTIGYSLP
jgi:hypothetical protein